MFRLPYGLYFSACLGSLFVSILCTCCSHLSGSVNKELTKQIEVYLVFEILIGLRLVKYLSLRVIGELLSVFTQKTNNFSVRCQPIYCELYFIRD